MASKPLSAEIIKETLAAYKKCKNNATKASEMIGIPYTTFMNRLKRAKSNNLKAKGSVKEINKKVKITTDEVVYSDEEMHKIKTLEQQIKQLQKNELSNKLIRKQIMGLSEVSANPPSWINPENHNKKQKEDIGVPTLMFSDWHWGEVIDPTQINGVNQYNLDIAHKRAKNCIFSAIDLLRNHMKDAKYPGFILALGGDMVSGDIHDELTATNEIPLIPCVLNLFDVLVECISILADEFGAVFVPCVTGNHGRNTQKIRAKDRHHTSFDWLLYVLLEKHFKNDSRVTFNIPNGSDCLYKVYGHRYLLTHGDQFRGGDSMIGCLGPIIRGDHKKRSRNSQIDEGYDTMMLGHWHQLIQMQRLIVNGSLCGYNEYAYAGNFGFEEPKQALWITHESRGITFSMPVHAEKKSAVKKESWVSIKSNQK